MRIGTEKRQRSVYKLHSFAPIVTPRSRILILGSMPSVMSLEKNQYYGNPQNQFWKIIYAVFGCDASDHYHDKITFLKKNTIALWDLIESCERIGSSDAAIKNVRPNAVRALLEEHRAIAVVLFNGQTAEKIFKKNIGLDAAPAVTFHVLPSTSPANAVKYEVKFEKWRNVIRECLSG